MGSNSLQHIPFITCNFESMAPFKMHFPDDVGLFVGQFWPDSLLECISPKFLLLLCCSFNGNWVNIVCDACIFEIYWIIVNPTVVWIWRTRPYNFQEKLYLLLWKSGCPNSSSSFITSFENFWMETLLPKSRRGFKLLRLRTWRVACQGLHHCNVHVITNGQLVRHHFSLCQAVLLCQFWWHDLWISDRLHINKLWHFQMTSPTMNEYICMERSIDLLPLEKSRSSMGCLS